MSDPRPPTVDDAISAYQAGRFEASVELFAALRQDLPEDADLLRLHGLALVRVGRTGLGLPLLARSCAAAPGSALAHLHHGVGLLSAGLPARAAARFRRATMLAPQDPAGWINFASALLALGQPRAARAAARRALALAPESAAALRALGCGHAALGDLPRAAATLSEAVRRAPTDADAWIDLGYTWARQGEIASAMRCMRRILAFAPEHDAAQASLAALSILTGEQEEALVQLRAILDRNPGCVAARLNLANALLLDGQAADALALLNGVIPAGREGAFWRAYQAIALILLGRDAEATTVLDAIPLPSDAQILIIGRRLHLAERAGEHAAAHRLAEQLTKLADQPGTALYEHRVVAEFDLGRYHVRAGRKREAFGRWTQGHELMARVQPFSREEYEAFFATTESAYGAERLDRGARAVNDDETPVFIVGLPRSGTTLCEQILAAHPSVYGSGERTLMHRLITSLAGPPLRAATIATLAALGSDALTAAAASFLVGLRNKAPAARFIIDKMPANALHLGFIATLLPRARVILCQRDPRDIGLSIFQLRFFGYHPYAHRLEDLGWYIRRHGTLMAHWRRVLPLTMLEVHLTDWTDDFAGTLGRVLEFLDLPFDPACETFYRNERPVRTASAAQVRRPINRAGIGRWKAYQDELAPMLAALGPE